MTNLITLKAFVKYLTRSLAKKSTRLFSRYLIRDRKKSYNRSKVKRVSFLLAGGIGDHIMAYPAIQFLKQKLPETEIDIFVPPEKCSIISALFEDLHVKPFKFSLPFILKHARPRHRFDLSFTNTIAVFKVTIEIAAFLSSRMSYGFRYQEEMREDRLYRNSKIFSGVTHAIEQNVQLVSETLKAPYAKDNLLLPTAPQQKKDQTKKDVIIHPGSEAGYENKRWPLENFIEIVSKLTEKGYTISELLGPSEKNLQKAFASVNNVQLLIEPDIHELIDTYKNAALFIGNDSGPAHLAAFYGVPAITLFGPINPERSGPVAITNTSIYNNIKCSPCHFTLTGCPDNQCMKSITVEQVWKEVEKKLV